MSDRRPISRMLFAGALALGGGLALGADSRGSQLADAMLRMMGAMGMLGQGAGATAPGWGAMDPGAWGSGWPSQGFPNTPATGLDGLWVSPSGERLVIRGQAFRLHAGAERRLEGIVQVRGNLLAMRATGADQTWFYEYAHQDGRLVLKDASGQIYLYRRVEGPGIPIPFPSR